MAKVKAKAAIQRLTVVSTGARRTIIVTAAVASLATIAACAAGTAESSAGSSPSQAAAASSPTAAALTCGDISTDLAKVVSDLGAQDAHYQEAWVSGGDSSDLQTLINDTQNAVRGANQLNDDAVTFNQDAASYLSDNSPALAPGWQSGYSTVTNDVNALAKECGQQTAPVNTPQNS